MNGCRGSPLSIDSIVLAISSGWFLLSCTCSWLHIQQVSIQTVILRADHLYRPNCRITPMSILLPLQLNHLPLLTLLNMLLLLQFNLPLQYVLTNEHLITTRWLLLKRGCFLAAQESSFHLRGHRDIIVTCLAILDWESLGLMLWLSEVAEVDVCATC